MSSTKSTTLLAYTSQRKCIWWHLYVVYLSSPFSSGTKSHSYDIHIHICICRASVSRWWLYYRAWKVNCLRKWWKSEPYFFIMWSTIHWMQNIPDSSPKQFFQGLSWDPGKMVPNHWGVGTKSLCGTKLHRWINGLPFSIVSITIGSYLFDQLLVMLKDGQL